ncbi:hypothetical protein [Paraflavitalea pollutisoli]|uniref:hypothetical protein n=1 Tax=Paraflavitalea pollutisoli TaxID=3034143 RepID=UPI0023ECD33C|nr:hypothetical protein [Paraflavitalea sp. H1-2-19X]
MEELQKNVKYHTLRTLECISSVDALLMYKKDVPFVHVGQELLAQCETIERCLTWDWFMDFWTDAQMLALEEFVDVYSTTSDMYNQYMPDVPELLEDKRWLHFMRKTKELLLTIGESTKRP